MEMEEGWKAKEAVEHYSRVADIAIPYRSEILSLIARLTVASVPRQPKLLDLGCGYGDVTSAILSLNPQASVYMIDFSDEMIKLSGARFKEDNNVKVIKHDLNTGLPASIMSIKFDAVVSCFALHHIEFANRVVLYSDIRNALVADGLFINGDRFKEDSSFVDQWEFDNWINWMVQQIKQRMGKDKSFGEVKQTQVESDKKLGDKPGTIWDMKQDLVQAGFRFMDCIWKSQNLGVIVATNRNS